MSSYSVIYKGPSSLDDPEKAERVANAIASKYPLSAAEAKQRLYQVPFVLISQLTQPEAERRVLFLKAMGANVEMKEDPARPGTADISPRDTHFPESYAGGLNRSSLKSVIYALSPGLLIILVILVAGVAQIVASPFITANGEPFWILSAFGWGTVGLALIILIGVITLRLNLIVSVLEKPDLSTPVQTLSSFYKSVNSRNWEKALACLGARLPPEKLSTAEELKDERLRYLKSLSRELVLSESVDPSSITFMSIDEGEAEVRFLVTTTGRQTMPDGARIRRSFFDVCRFAKDGDKWYLLDHTLLGQNNPARLPLPGCRNCGAEAQMGQITCTSCDASVPPYATESEIWLSPKRKPDLAALLSALIPGLGQTYNGQPLKGAIIAGTSWMVLPWAAGVIDAIVVADRINRKSSTHDLQRPAASMITHAVVFVLAVVFVILNAERVPLLRDIIDASRPPEVQVDRESVIARFRGTDGDYSILFPYRWNVEEIPDPDDPGSTAVKGSSRDGTTTILISTRAQPSNWESCPQAMETRRRLEESEEEIANFTCGTKGGRDQYRIDSYTQDNLWRRTILVLSYGNELVLLAFVCPVEQQSNMVEIFESVSNSLRYVEQSDTAIPR